MLTKVELKLEQIRNRATRMIRAMKNLSLKRELKKPGLFSKNEALTRDVITLINLSGSENQGGKRAD